jgi:two-component sensor histidine kinase
MTSVIVWIAGFLCPRRGVRAAPYHVTAWSVLILGITMIPCVLIVHELIANALQHAYPRREHGEIHLDLSAGNNGRYTLRVHGNGGGFPEGIDFRRVELLGLKIVTRLTQQLDGVIELQRNGGTTLTLTFSERKYRKRTSVSALS